MRVFILSTQVLIPELLDPVEIADAFYPVDKVGRKINLLAKKMVDTIGIEKRPFVLDLKNLPEKRLRSEEDHPLYWGEKIINNFVEIVGRDSIGFLSMSYNISYHTDYLPNLITQIVLKTGLKLDRPPEELPYYGCASGVISIKNAVSYCRTHGKAAVVFVFDQCSNLAYIPTGTDDPYIKKTMKSNLLFSDGAAGLLIIPESMKPSRSLPEIIEVQTGYTPGDGIKMENGAFLLRNQVKDIVPPVVSEKVIKPVLEKHNLRKEDIKEWSIHQGGLAIINKLKDEEILGLSESQIKRSKELFHKYGNLSSPSCFLTFDSFFNEKKNKSGDKGMIVGFGAGYYMASALYVWS
ncbi:Predicted naringenin-chalcone synthase [Persephonella hydrogeniphila]|uniref:Predicted naringenin-chalcone synthase n=1 Tax=Persephonella hydrogeniphila TaxID=198703 RepID=A0A285NIU9_9AQUI|nr:3-oxoacyl-[acyl-carrier-protein] synthase III C-terminal domain-containing protein [Persephonella hydrogeniphila]SNZ07776.1 Predicted naringenin-chalcone synthase [Persephonella hydrogeniphila]